MRDLQSRSDINSSRNLRYIVKQCDIRCACDMLLLARHRRDKQKREEFILYRAEQSEVYRNREKGRLYRIRLRIYRLIKVRDL